MSTQDSWIKDIESDVEKFATEHHVVLWKFSKQPSALFEIGVLHFIARFYDSRRGTKVTPENLQEDGLAERVSNLRATKSGRNEGRGPTSIISIGG